jgi:hypothetical protein
VVFVTESLEDPSGTHKEVVFVTEAPIPPNQELIAEKPK